MKQQLWGCLAKCVYKLCTKHILLQGVKEYRRALPVVPVEEQPVDSFKLIFSQRVAILVLSGLLQLLP